MLQAFTQAYTLYLYSQFLFKLYSILKLHSIYPNITPITYTYLATTHHPSNTLDSRSTAIHTILKPLQLVLNQAFSEHFNSTWLSKLYSNISITISISPTLNLYCCLSHLSFIKLLIPPSISTNPTTEFPSFFYSSSELYNQTVPTLQSSLVFFHLISRFRNICFASQ